MKIWECRHNWHVWIVHILNLCFFWKVLCLLDLLRLTFGYKHDIYLCYILDQNCMKAPMIVKMPPQHFTMCQLAALKKYECNRIYVFKNNFYNPVLFVKSVIIVPAAWHYCGGLAAGHPLISGTDSSRGYRNRHGCSGASLDNPWGPHHILAPCYPIFYHRIFLYVSLTIRQ